MAAYVLDRKEDYFPPDFKEYMERELKWSRVKISVKPDGNVCSCPFSHDSEWKSIKWVFWSRQDDYPDRPLYHDNFVSSIPNACSSPEVRENVRYALEKMTFCPCLEDSLVQFWAPTKTLEGRTVLTTRYQPFALGSPSIFNESSRKQLCEYRMKMSMEDIFFYADAESGEEQLGVPGRVFLHKFPEFNPDVRYYSLKEYPQRDLALHCCIGASWALPVFERSSQTCVGVLEILSQYDAPLSEYGKNFLGHLDDIFEEFGLQCYYGCKDCEMREEDGNKAFKELEMVLESVCKIHKLPLAMTWVPCSTCDYLLRFQHLSMGEDFFGLDVNLSFHDLKSILKSCHSRKGQVTGRILSFAHLSYCSDVKQFSIAEYPLVAYFRRLKLSGWFAMCLQSSSTGSALYVLEFFLPTSSKDDENILTKLSLILRTMEENVKTFKLASGQEWRGVLSVEVIDFLNGQKSYSVQMDEATRFFPSHELLEDGGGILQLGQPDQPAMDEVNSGMNVVIEAENYNFPSFEPLQSGKVAMQLDSYDQPSMEPPNNGHNVVITEQKIIAINSSKKCKRKPQERERNKIGVRIEVSLEDILKCSKMRRENAARELKVSISTLKRVCRGYGIPRWPPRNMEKVHSSQPFPVENQEQAPQPNPDSPSSQASASGVHIKPAFQDVDLVTIKAKYGTYTIKFRLSLSPRLVELEEAVAKRLNLEAGSYCVFYKDEEDELIFIACDQDLQDCASYFRSVGNTSIALQLVPKQTLQWGVGHTTACVFCSNGLDP